ncbi:FtsX-like permease family protein [Dactylosporangium sp. CA-092794]|uniref:FtsX-like permease family protein n=1 Tax=Dactylosporangium sp. CA-092794 TaxID=3239929 RepID=UPI003D91A979
MSLSMLRYHRGSFLGTFVALLLGVAVIAGCLSLWASARPRVPAELSAAEVIVAAPRYDPPGAGFASHRPWSADEVDRLVTALARTPGVAAAVPDRPFYVQRLVDGRPDDDAVGGRGWASAGLGRYPLKTGKPPQHPGEVVVPERLGVPVGAPLPMLTAAGPATWTVTGTIDAPGYYADDATARSLAGGVKFIGLRLAPGARPGDVAARLPAALGGLGTALTGDARAAAEPERDARSRWIGTQLIIATVFVGGFVAVFVVASTCAFGVAQRRRELALLRAAGATPGQVRRLLLAEAGLVAAAAGLPGALLGTALAPLLSGPLVAVGLEPAGFRVGFTWWAPPAALAAGLVVGVAGVWLAARRASRVPALDALRVAAAEPRPMTLSRWLVGLLALVVGGGLALLVPGATAERKATIVLGSAMVLLVAAALLAPVCVAPIVRLVTWPVRRGATGLLVRAGARVAARRVASAAAPVLAAVGFAVLLVGTFQTAEAAVRIEDTGNIPEAAVAAPGIAAPGLSEAAVQAQAGRSELASTVYLDSGRPLDAAGAAVEGLVASPTLGWAPGRAVSLRFVDGSVRSLTVAEVSDRAFPDSVVLPRDLIRAHDPAALTPVVYLAGDFVPAPGAERLTARQYVDRKAGEEADLVDLFLAVLLGIAVGYTALSVANTLLMATHARRAEFLVWHQAGATTGQSVRVVVAEALLAVLVGALLGLAVAVPALLEARAGFQEEIGRPVSLVMPWGTAAAVVSACAALAAAAAAWPFLRRRPGSATARTMAG